MTKIFHAGNFRHLAPVFIFFILPLGCIFLFLTRLWRYDAFPAEKQIAKTIELASYGSDLKNNNLDYCIPKLGLPVCSADLLENDPPGTQCFIQKCRWGHVTNLILYGGQLEALPAQIAGLPGLVELNLHQNNLTSLPAEIGQLGDLTELDLSGNHLTNLPAEIGQLSNLKKLDLSGNDLTSLPPEIGLLGNLIYLNIGNNPIRGPLPDFLTNLTLDALIFSKTDLCVPVGEDFQEWISKVSLINFHDSPRPDDLCSLAAEDQQAMQALDRIPGRPTDWDVNKIPCAWSRVGCDAAGHITRLDLSSLKLDRLPPEIWRLGQLQSLNLTNSQITDLPAEIGKLDRLTHLYLGSNQLTRLPLEIGQLHNLTELNLDHNRLTSLPAEIGQLQNLSSLNLYGNQLTRLPQEVGQLTKLTLFDVSDNPLNGPLPAFLTQIPNVTFIFSNTNLCIPNNDEMIGWLGRQSKAVYTYSESGELVYEPSEPEAFIRSALERQGCR